MIIPKVAQIIKTERSNNNFTLSGVPISNNADDPTRDYRR